MNPIIGWFILAVWICCFVVPGVVLLVGTIREINETDPFFRR